jgi:DNA-3-methyladenine glycosylase
MGRLGRPPLVWHWRRILYSRVALVFAPPGRAERGRILARLAKPAHEAAPALLGHLLLRRIGRRVLHARIVEAEAYLPKGDPGAHVFRGRTPRTAPLFGPPGNIYVYVIYGMYHCLNLAVDDEGVPGCVLVRAAELLESDDANACRGPGRLCRTLDLTARDSGANLFAPGARLVLREGRRPRQVATSRRIGVNEGAEHVLRFFDADSAAVSGPRRRLV